jgi:hypothetical protein
MEQLSENLICNFVVEDDQQTVVVEIETISILLCVFKNYGGPAVGLLAPSQRYSTIERDEAC